MEQKKKKLNFKIIIILLAIVVLAVIGIVAFTSINNSKLTQEEQFAVNVLLQISHCDYYKLALTNNPHNLELNKVWVYKENNQWFIACDYICETFSMTRKCFTVSSSCRKYRPIRL